MAADNIDLFYRFYRMAESLARGGVSMTVLLNAFYAGKRSPAPFPAEIDD